MVLAFHILTTSTFDASLPLVLFFIHVIAGKFTFDSFSMMSSNISRDIITLHSDNESFYRLCQCEGKKPNKSHPNMILFSFIVCN